MAEVKWIKITTDIFDDEKVLLIESLPESDSIIVIWFKLLCLAGKMNNSGVFMLNDSIAYTDQMLATIFRRKEATVKMALNVFEDFGMIDRFENVITIPNWGKHQNLDSLENKKEYMRGYMRDYRKKQKLLAVSKTNGNSNSITNVSSLEEERERDKEEGEREEEERVKIDYQQIADMYNATCVSFPRLTKLSEARKKSIKARLNQYTVDDFSKLFEMAESSSFLKGKNDRNWSATFDWLMKDSNMAKVLDGNYINSSGAPGPKPKQDKISEVDSW
ncbi:phage replisome organizer N-terminal domain-containing protein [Faecalicatena contorta]|uniref:Phage replisome organizer, putative, N-terminal region n=1 Tax=Faecalicatena contorta TaxID=39482 RepID=A0A315ZXT4_9FIRM|nr:phage replisome organizer N-terminal domain-containing protein [Faecalicatena contorta]PWJ49324.1 putative phage replisome organizer [Faecalicatena contorta]SUQ14568.1 phage replisome organizer, putative, N-terminal region [Faecalicatena contorta]